MGQKSSEKHTKWQEQYHKHGTLGAFKNGTHFILGVHVPGKVTVTRDRNCTVSINVFFKCQFFWYIKINKNTKRFSGVQTWPFLEPSLAWKCSTHS